MVNREKAIAVLKTVNDPEIMYNVWDLGLIYGLDVSAAKVVKIKMTMTTPFCPYGPALVDEVKTAIERELKGVAVVEVEVVWEPPWSLDKLAPEIRAELGLTS